MGTCASGVIPNPPMTNPSASASITGVTNTLLPVITRTWNGGSSSLGNAAVTQVRQTASGNWSAAARTGSTSSTGSWGSTHYMQVRSAATQRLANWGFWTQANAHVSQSAAGWGVSCPVTTPIESWIHTTAGVLTYSVHYTTVTNSYCEVQVNFISNDRTREKQTSEYFFPREKERCLSGWWGTMPVPPAAYEHCVLDAYGDNGWSHTRDYAYKLSASTYEGIATGTHIATYRYTYGSTPIPSPNAYVRTYYNSTLVSRYSLPNPQYNPGGCPMVLLLSCS